MKKTIQERVFIVGCPRSGTTLLQCLLAANSHIASFPESHFYEKLFSGKRVLAALGIASPRARRRWRQYLEELGREDVYTKLPAYAIQVHQFSQVFVQVLDELTLEQGRTIWVEKTPGHLRFVDQIEGYIPGVKFVHTLRRGEDVVASLYDIGIHYPELWGGYTQSIDLAIRRWTEDTQLSIKYSTRENHFLLRYENLIEDPKRELLHVCGFINISFEENMLTDYAATIPQVVLEREPWKATVGNPIRVPNISKFNILFSEDQKQYISQRLSEDILGKE